MKPDGAGGGRVKKESLPTPAWRSDWWAYRWRIMWLVNPIIAVVLVIDDVTRRPWWADLLLYAALGVLVEIIGSLAYRMGRQHQLAIHAHLADEWISQVEPGRAQASKDN